MTTTNQYSMINTILQTVIRLDSTLRGFTPDDLPVAARARIQNTLVSLERNLTTEDLDELEKWTGGNEIFSASTFECSEGECRYYVFGDGSLYFRSSGDSEVWSDAADFANERIINGYTGKLDAMDAALLRHLGGQYLEEVSSRLS